MKINAYRGASLGTAYIEITGIPTPANLDQVRFAIFSQVHQKSNLGPGGWQAGEALLIPQKVEGLSEGVKLFLGPEVVDHMEPGTYSFKLLPGDTPPQSGGLGWRNIPPRPADARQNIKDAPAETSTPPTRPSQRPPAPEAPPPPQPSPPTPTSPPTPPPTPGKAEIKIELSDSSEDSAEDQPTGKSPLIWIVLAVVVVVLAGGGWWFWQSPKEPSAQTAALAPLAKVREDLGRNISPDQALAAGKAMLGQPGNADAAFLYLEYAAQAGQAEAALLLGRFYDPTDASPTGSILKSLSDAYEWYAKAREGGQPEAEAALAKLKAEAQRLADQGDDNAKALLARWR